MKNKAAQKARENTPCRSNITEILSSPEINDAFVCILSGTLYKGQLLHGCLSPHARHRVVKRKS